MTGCILLTVIGLLPIIFSDHWMYPIIGRAMIGIGSSAAILATFKIIRMNFNAQHFSRMLGFSVTIGLAGAIYGGEPVSYLCNVWDYKTVVVMFVAAGILLACITWLIVPDVQPERQTSIISNIKTVFTHGKVIMLCCFAGLMLGPLEGFSDVWGPEFLKQVYGFEAKTAHYLPSMIFIGMCFGAPILSLVAEKSGQYLGVIIAAGAIMLLTFTALVAGVLTVSSMTITFIMVGICCAYQILAIYKASTYVPDNLVGLTTAVANMIIMSFGYAFHTAIGFIINVCGGTHVARAFVYGIGIIPVTLGIGITGFLFLAYREKCVQTWEKGARLTLYPE